MQRSQPLIGGATLLAACALLGSCDRVDPGPVDAVEPATAGWSYYGADKAFTRYAPLDLISRDNIDSVEVLWRRPAVAAQVTEEFPDVGLAPYLKSTPVLVDGVLYAPDAIGLVEAFDPGTGETIWVQELVSSDELSEQSSRGVDFWSDGSDRRVLAVRGKFLYALDAATGSVEADFGDQGRVNLTPSAADVFGWSAGPIVVGDVVVIAGTNDGAGDGGMVKESTPENVRGYDVRSGELLWTFNVVPKEGELGVDTWGNDSWRYSGDLGSWCCLSADEELGYVYVPLSAPTSAYWGGHRPGDNLFSNTLVAIRAATGELAWHFQMVHHDVWEYDNVGPPVLGDITVDGRRIRAVMQGSKTGFLYVFDRATGEPVWPIEERPVPQSSVPGEQTAATQPFPTKPPPFGHQGVTEDDLIDFTPELRAQALALAEGYVTGPLFTPPSMLSDEPGGTKGTLMVPGAWGSGNWNNGAFDPETGMFYAVSHMLPGVYGITRASDPDATMDYFLNFQLAGPAPTIEGLSIIKPPYGRITAIDMNRGERAWMVANGDGPRDHPLLRDLDLPPLGFANRAAPLVTRSFLFIGEGSDAIMGTAEDMWGPMFRAYDKATGEVVWEIELDAGTTGGPMSYMHDGNQFIVVAIGGTQHPPEFIALGLP